MTANGVNLDALIPREDFSATSAPAKGNPTGSISIGQLADDSFLAQSLRKPDFQRETTNWTPQKIVDLVAAFLDGDLIPAVILWRSGQFVFVIDGAHRLSAILAWLYNDYGDKHRSVTFFENQVPEEQIKLAEQTRKLVDQEIGSYASYVEARKTIAYATEKMKERLGGLAANSFIAQWVPAVDAIGAENSFFKINQSPTPVDPVEKRILKGRKSASAIATRAINRGGAGHKYWAHLPIDIQNQIEQLGSQIHSALYDPPLGSATIKSSDVPVGGRGYSSLPFIFDLVNLVNGVGASKEPAKDDPDGQTTVSYLNAVQKRLQRITTNHPGSLGLHPLAYFYTRGGAFQPVAFLAAMQVVGRLEERNNLDKFTSVRRSFELFLMKHKEAFTLVVKRQGSGPRSRPALESFMEIALDCLWKGQTDEEIIGVMALDPRFSFFATPAPIREASSGRKKTFDSSAKSAAFVIGLENSGVRCAICDALLHVNSMQTDHIIRQIDGGGSHSGNAQVVHPYCNSTYKEGMAKASSSRRILAKALPL